MVVWNTAISHAAVALKTTFTYHYVDVGQVVRAEEGAAVAASRVVVEHAVVDEAGVEEVVLHAKSTAVVGGCVALKRRVCDEARAIVLEYHRTAN